MATKRIDAFDPIDALADDDEFNVWDTSAEEVANVTGAQLFQQLLDRDNSFAGDNDFTGDTTFSDRTKRVLIGASALPAMGITVHPLGAQLTIFSQGSSNPIGTTVIGSPVVELTGGATNTLAMSVGQGISANAPHASVVPAGATVLSIEDATHFTMSEDATASQAGITFTAAADVHFPLAIYGNMQTDGKRHYIVVNPDLGLQITTYFQFLGAGQTFAGMELDAAGCMLAIDADVETAITARTPFGPIPGVLRTDNYTGLIFSGWSCANELGHSHRAFTMDSGGHMTINNCFGATGPNTYARPQLSLRDTATNSTAPDRCLSFRMLNGLGYIGIDTYSTDVKGSELVIGTAMVSVRASASFGVGTEAPASRIHVIEPGGNQLRLGADVSNYFLCEVGATGATTFDGVGAGALFTFLDPVAVTTHIEGTEIADPAAPAANKGRLYFKDNGSGKTQLAVRFPTGAVQILATEP